MRNIDPSIIAQLESGQIIAFLLVKMTIDGTDYLYTDCDVAIATGGETYENRGIQLRDIVYSSNQIVDKTSISLDNLDDMLTSVFVGGTPQGSPIYMYIAVLDSSYQVIGSPVTAFEGEIDDWSLSEGELEVTAASLFKQWDQQTLNVQTPSCRWDVFGGTECGYANASSTWCDRTYTRCSALGNTANFGGERWLPSIVDKTIWWGKIPKGSD